MIKPKHDVRWYGNRISQILLLVLFFSLSGSVAQAQGDGLPRGAFQMPYTRYESDATSQSQALAHTDYDFLPDVAAAEASSQHYLGLNSDGDFVQWTVNEFADGVTLRFTIPDNSTGDGNQGALNVYVNGALDQTITLNSYWAFHYLNKFQGAQGGNAPNQGFSEVRMYFDDINFKLNTPLSPGSTIRLEKTGGSPFEYGIDFIEIEEIDPIKGPPANYLSVTDAPYNANGNDQVDDLAAFHACLADANAQGKNMYIPAGKYYLDGQFRLNASNIKVQGAGIWHTELFFSSDLAFSGGVKARADNLEFSDVHVTTNNNDRFCPDDERIPGWNEPYKGYKGIFGTWGSYSVIKNVWVEHFETGMWFADYDWAVEGASQPDITNNLLVTNARIRNNYADGVNFAEGSNNCTVEHTNIRNSGDDGFAVWSSDAFGHGTPGSNNTLQFSTVENVWRAGGVAFHGADGHGVNHVLIRDGRGCAGIRFTDTFPGFKFLQNNQSVMSNITIINHGTTYDLFNEEIGAIYLSGAAGLWNVYWEDIDLINSQRHAITLEGGPYQNIEFHSLKVDGTGLDPYDHNTVVYTDGGTGIAASANGQIDLYNPQWISWETQDSIITTGNLTVNTYFTEPVGVQSVNMPDGPLTLVVGEVTSLAPTFAPQNASNKAVTYTNSNPSVGTINQVTGAFEATGVGQTTITVTSDDNPAATDQVTINVTAAVNVEAVSSQANESGATGEFVFSTTELSASLTVSYAVTGSASAGDYSASPSLTGSVILTPSNLSQSIIITAVDDSDFEGNESLTINIVDNGNYNIGVGSATITIVDNENPPCTAPVIGLTANAPGNNNSIEAEWSEVPARGISNVTVGGMPGDFSGQWRAMYDNQSLYVLVEVSDNSLNNDSGSEWWNDDVVNIFIDGNNSKGTSFDGVNDFQIGFRWNDGTVHLGGNSVQNASGITFNMFAVSGGYTLKAAIPWSTIGVSPSIGYTIGFDVAVDDDDGGGTRDAQISSFATTEMGWSNPSLFGSVYMTTCEPITPTTPVITSDLEVTRTEGDEINYTIVASNFPESFGATNLPSGISLNSSTGLLSGTLATAGTFNITISATNAAGTDSETLALTVNEVAEQPPVASVTGSSITLPANSTSVDGSASNDPDGTISSYFWVQLSGPNSATLSGHNTAILNLSGLIEGSYQFELTVTDNDGNTDAAISTVTVSTEPTYPSDRGYYDAPYTRYEASGASAGGGAEVLPFSMSQADLQFEATDRTAVKLNSSGQYVQWTTSDPGQGMVIRYSMPDAPNGGGLSGSLALYIDGNFYADIDLTSKWAYNYFDNVNSGDPNLPRNDPGTNRTIRMRYDEKRVKLDQEYPAGTTFRLERNAASGSVSHYIVDFMELESIPAPVPFNASTMISVEDFGAVKNDGSSDTQPFVNAINAARTSGETLYIPEGVWDLQFKLSIGHDITIQGAGMWHTELHFLQGSPSAGGISADGSNVHISDMYLSTENTIRTSDYKGITGSYGSNSTIERMWVVHHETGAWIWQVNGVATSNVLVKDCRFRNNYADGINLSSGTSYSLVEHCDMRNNLDDAIASWSPSDGPTACLFNEFRYCTTENTLRAAGVGFFGGGGHKAHHIIVKDNTEAGLRINSDFPGYQFTNDLIEFSNITVIGSGTNANLWSNRYGAIDIFTRLYNINNVTFDNIDIIDSQKDAIFIYAVNPSYTIQNLQLSNITINGTGLDENQNNFTSGTYDDYAGYAVLMDNQIQASVTICDLSVTNAASQPDVQMDTPGNINLTYCNSVDPTGISLNPTSLSLNSGNTGTITATVSPADATNKSVTWASSNTNVATVSNGVVTAVSDGTAIITASTVNGITSTASVTVSTLEVLPTSVTLDCPETLDAGQTHQLTWTVLPTSATNKNVTFATSNSSVLSVNTGGLLTANTAGTATITVTTSANGLTDNCQIDVIVVEQDPYLGSPVSLPGTVEVENFDTGGAGVAYSDTDTGNNGGAFRTGENVDIENCSAGGYNLGWNAPGEWQEYTVDVTQSGSYDFEFRVSSPYDAGTFHVEFAGQNATGTVTSINTGGWQNWQSVYANGVNLSAGQQVMRVIWDNPNHNLDKIIITNTGGGSNQSPSANAGTDQTLNAGITSASLNGSGSDPDNDPVTYSWTQISGPSAIINTSSSASASVSGLTDGNSYVFRLTVSDGTLTATDDVTISVDNGSSSGFRIRNRWQNTYLGDGGATVTYSSSGSGDNYLWVLEDVGGGNVEIRNVGTGEYMHIENLTGNVQSTSRTFGWYSSRWALENVDGTYSRIRNAWQGSHYIHVENLNGSAQHGTIDFGWQSAQWELESVGGARMWEQPKSIAESSSDILIYPNPVFNGIISINFGHVPFGTEYEILTLSGVILYSSSIQSQIQSLDVSELKAGLYMIRVNDGNKRSVKRLIVK
ncbi:MAG: sugar-binding protein [Marinoscillum sp.]